MAEDKREQDLVAVNDCEWVRALDSNGNSIKISKADLFYGLLGTAFVYEGDVDILKQNGIYYTNGITQHANGNAGLFLVFSVNGATVQFSFNVFNNAFSFRVLLYNGGLWDQWSVWRSL